MPRAPEIFKVGEVAIMSPPERTGRPEMAMEVVVEVVMGRNIMTICKGVRSLFELIHTNEWVIVKERAKHREWRLTKKKKT